MSTTVFADLGTQFLYRCHVIAGLAILGPFLWFFGVVLFGGESFLFLETSYFYYPLFEWISAEWKAGRIPLWNPQENCGLPVIGDSTSSVFYPGKLIFALPIGFPLKFKLYIVAHVLLAAAGAYVLARRWDRSVLAGAICGLSFAFGGAVFFTYTNVVFLVGAAWLPIAVLAADRMLVERRVRWALLLAMVLALMVLGGDPQGAYHAGLISALYACLLWRSDRRDRQNSRQTNDAPHDANSAFASRCKSVWRSASANRFVLLTIAAVSGVLLAAVQVLPSAQWSRQSERAMFDVPRSLYEIPAVINRSSRAGESTAHAWSQISQGLFGQPSRFTHYQDIYEASVAPWRAAEWIWPNFSGKVLPDRYYRWLDSFTEAQWATPSLYMGLVPFLLAISSWTLRSRSDARIRWLSWIVLLSVLGSFGSYGVGWMINQLLGHSGFMSEDELPWIGDPVGGVYWLMVTLLPGYAQFRDPAKLLVVGTLGLSVLAAFGWDRTDSDTSVGLGRKLRWLGLTSVVGAFVALALLPKWEAFFGQKMASQLFGPWNMADAWLDLFVSMIHTAVLCGMLLVPLAGDRAPAKSWLRPTVLLLTAIEICLASGWMVPSASDRIYQSEPRGAIAVGQQTEGTHQQLHVLRVMRQLNATAAPHEWETTASSDRLAQLVQWRRDWFFPRFHLPTGMSLVESELSIVSSDFAAVMDVSRRFQYRERLKAFPRELPLPYRNVLNALGARFVLLPVSNTAGIQQLRAAGDIAIENVALIQNPDCFPRAWIVRKVEQLPVLTARNPRQIADRTQEVFFPDGRARDLRTVALVETNLEVENLENQIGTAVPATQSCKVVEYQPQRVEIDVRLEEPAIVVLSDLFYPGWTAKLLNSRGETVQSLEILRTNRIMRGVFLPRGNHRVVYEYRPRDFYIGAAVSIVAWLVLGLALLTPITRPH